MPAHLKEISPRESRATFPGFTYQFGNFLAAGHATIHVMLAAFGPQAKEVRMSEGSGGAVGT